MNIDTKHHIERVIKDLEKNANNLKIYVANYDDAVEVNFQTAIDDIDRAIASCRNIEGFKE